jgi:bilirubin oxidase
MKYYEIPIVIQDRSFNDDGALFYADSRSFFDGFGGPYIPTSDISPIWNPEFFANTMVVNGKTWPYLEVEPRKYRFRLLNGCNSRFLILKIASSPMPAIPATPALPFLQIGTEGGFLPAPVQLDQLLIGLAERADVIVDFSTVPVGTELYLINEGPDEPFGGGVPGQDFPVSDPFTTGQVMKFVVVAPASADTSTHPAELKLPKFKPLGPATVTRQVSLNEEMSMTTCVDADNVAVPCDSPDAVDYAGPAAAKLGILDADGNGIPLAWMDAITENPALGGHGRQATRTRLSPIPERSPGSRQNSISPVSMYGTATSLNTRTTR